MNAIYQKFVTKTEAENFIQGEDTKYRMSTQTDYVESQLNIPPDYFVYTDGSCINNGKPNAKAGIGIFLI